MSAAGPPAPPPLGPPPADGDVTQGPAVNAVQWVLAGISLVFFVLRVYARRTVTRNLGIEDAVMGFALVLILVESSLVSKSIEHGVGRHMYYVGLPELSKALKWQTIAMPFAIIGSCVPKIVVTLFLIKIVVPNRLSVAYLWALNLLLNAISIATSVVVFVQCTPVSAQWTKMGKCWDPNIVTRIGIAQGSFAAFADFSLALFPLTTIWTLQMSRANKLGVSFLMGLGVFAGVAGVVKATKLPKLNAQADITWELWSLVLWVLLELNIVFICACVPAIRPLWAKYLGEYKSTRASSGKAYRYGSSERSGYILQSGGKKNERHGKNIDKMTTIDVTSSRGSETRLTDV